MNILDKENDKAEEDQLEWLEEQLSENSDYKFIIHMHIPPGMWYYTKDQQFWKNESIDTFLEIVSKYQDRILILLGAHVHSGEIRAPLSFLHKDLTNLTIMMTPGVAPIFKNNPGYTILSLKDFDMEAKWRFFQLNEYIFLKRQDFITIEPEELFGFKLSDSSSIRAFSENLQKDSSLYAKYLITRMGFREGFATMASFLYPLISHWITAYEQKHYVCSMLNFEYEAYKACLMIE